MEEITVGRQVSVTDGLHKGKTGVFLYTYSDTPNKARIKLDNGDEVDVKFGYLELLNSDENFRAGDKVCIISGRFEGYLGKVRMNTGIRENDFFLIDLLDNLAVEICSDDMIKIKGATLFTK